MSLCASLLGEIDTVADGKQVDDNALRGSADGGQPGPLRAIGTALLELAGLAVHGEGRSGEGR